MPRRRDRKGKKACGFACETGYLKIHLAASNHCYIRVASWFRNSDTWGGWLSKAVRWRRASSKVAVGSTASSGAQFSGAHWRESSSHLVRHALSLGRAELEVQWPMRIFEITDLRTDVRCRYIAPSAGQCGRLHS